MLPLNLKIISKIKVGNETYFSKSGYHVSLFCLQNLSESQQKKILNFTHKYSVKLKEITNIYRLVAEENRKSIIVRVRLQGLKKLISVVNKHFSYSFVYPPTHITLFTLKEMVGGIGVNSISEYKFLTHQINQKDSQKLARSFKIIQ